MSILQKIHAVRQLGLAVVKTGKITGGINAPFASFPDVWSALKPALDEQQLSVGFCSSVLSLHGDSESVKMILEVSDGTERETFEFHMMVPERILNSRGSSVVNNAQRIANAQSYCKRTSLILFFGLSAGNEDEVERMMPTQDQTNIPGVVIPGPNTTWQSLTDGIWANVMAPEHDGKLEAIAAARGVKAMVALWDSFPDHCGLQAWAADWMSSAMEEHGWTWANVLDEDPTLPESMSYCNAADLRGATKAVGQLLRKGAAK